MVPTVAAVVLAIACDTMYAKTSAGTVAVPTERVEPSAKFGGLSSNICLTGITITGGCFVLSYGNKKVPRGLISTVPLTDVDVVTPLAGKKSIVEAVTAFTVQ